MSAGAPWRDSTLRVGPLVNIPTLLRDLGCNPDPVFARVGFKRDTFDDTENRISYLMGTRLLAECVTATGCEHFGLLLGGMTSPSHLGVAGFLVRTAATVGQALEALVQNLDLHDDGDSCSLSVEAEYARLSFHVHQPGISAIEQVYDLSTAIMVRIMRSLCGDDWNASEVLLVRRKPRDPAPYARFFRTMLFWDSETCSILFPSRHLDTRPPTADQLLHHHLEQESSVLHQMQQHELVDTLPQVLQRGLLLEQCSVRDIAAAFGLHERTLHRRLHSAGTTFRRELDGVRESLSMQLLESTSLPVCDIATALGYADSSGFIRAFHRWTGFSPANWRKRNRLN